MVSSATESIIKTALSTDQNVTTEEVKAVLLLLKGKSPASVLPTDDADQILTRQQVAALLGKSVQAVDVYGRRGIIKRVYLTGGGAQRNQAQGYSRRSVLDAIKNGIR